MLEVQCASIDGSVTLANAAALQGDLTFVREHTAAPQRGAAFDAAAVLQRYVGLVHPDAAATRVARHAVSNRASHEHGARRRDNGEPTCARQRSSGVGGASQSLDPGVGGGMAMDA